MTLEFQSVSKKVFEETHIAPTSLKLEPEVFNILLGPTLSGKTSLMRLMAGLDKPSTGKIFFEGVDVTKLPVQKRNVAMVYQQFINFPNMSVFDNIASPLRVQGLPETEIKMKVGKVSELLKLTTFLLQRRPAAGVVKEAHMEASVAGAIECLNRASHVVAQRCEFTREAGCARA